ncbi:MAG: Mur ligase family protein [Thermomicrobiales bacterium]
MVKQTMVARTDMQGAMEEMRSGLDPDATLQRFRNASATLDALIDRTPTPTDKSREAVRERAELRMGRLRRFLTTIGSPQDRYPIVHVTGTSGKGSTSTAIASILTAAGYRTGLHTSPYLQVPTEKLQLDGDLLAPDAYADRVDELMAAHASWTAAGEEPLTYGEMWVALALHAFAKAEADVAVIEVGAGGRYDLTNVITPIVSVVTSVGIDHTNTLGDTLAEIAWHKAGIIKAGAPAISAVTDPEAGRIVAAEAASIGVPLTEIPATLDVLHTGPDGTSWIDPHTGTPWTIALGGRFQARNGAVAVAAVRAAAPVLTQATGLPIGDAAIATGLRTARIPGRMELLHDRVPVLLDGAHNAEKIAALAADVPAFLPAVGGRRIAVLGALEAKQADEMIACLIPVVDEIVATAPQVLAKEAREAESIAETARRVGFHGPLIVEPVAQRAVERALENAGTKDAILVTGSLYLVGNVRDRWFGEEAMILQQTPWPSSPTSDRIDEL